MVVDAKLVREKISKFNILIILRISSTDNDKCSYSWFGQSRKQSKSIHSGKFFLYWQLSLTLSNYFFQTCYLIEKSVKEQNVVNKSTEVLRSTIILSLINAQRFSDAEEIVFCSTAESLNITCMSVHCNSDENFSTKLLHDLTVVFGTRTVRIWLILY